MFGNTPTCVGKSLWSRAAAMSLRKHPHVRGEESRLKIMEHELNIVATIELSNNLAVLIGLVYQ